MLLVVIGAGASFDCHGDLPSVHASVLGLSSRLTDARPPLANGLFDLQNAQHQRLITKFAAVRPLAAQLAKLGNTDALEDYLAQYAAQSTKHPARRRHVVALRYYIRDLLYLCTNAMLAESANSGVTRYVELAHTLREWAEDRGTQVCCVSFNYDYLFEAACRDVWGFDYMHFASYVGDPTFTVLKPHGSVLWERSTGLAVESGSSNSQPMECTVIEAAPGLADQPGPLRFWDTAAHQDPGLPALAPPMRGKEDFEWPDSQAAYFRSLTRQVTGLITVGWRAAEPHFVREMQPAFSGMALPTLVVTGGPNAETDGRATADNLGLSSSGDDPWLTFATEGFGGLLDGGQLTAWLEGR